MNLLAFRLTTGAAVEVHGTIVESLGAKQKYELKASSVSIVGECAVDSYPIQKKKASQEFLRTVAHLRPRTNTISAVTRVRSVLLTA